MMSRFLIMLYATICYLIGISSLLYSIGFIGDFIVPKTINTGPAASWAEVLKIDIPLLALFAVQHSGMARQGFKRWWTTIVPKPAERATYVLATGAVLGAIFWLWVPMPATVWQTTNPTAVTALTVLYLTGWGIVFLSSFLINHFELFGLQQGFDNLRGREFEPPHFYTPFLYKIVRHPLYMGLLILFWATPHMTQGHLLFSVMTTGYVIVGALLEERDLTAHFGNRYRQYRAQVPMLIPFTKTRRRQQAGDVA